MIMHGGIRYLLTGAAEDEIESLTICRMPSLGSFVNVIDYLPKKINGTGTTKNSRNYDTKNSN